MDKISVIGANKQDNLLKIIRPLQEIEGLYRAIDMAEKVLTDYIGIPICQEHCGKCCELTTPDVWEVEARFMVSAFAGDGGTRLEAITKASEEWLLDRNPNLKTYGNPFGMRNLTDEEWRKFQPEVNHLLLESPCPYLTSDKLCIMHDTRSLACRCFGVTRMPGQLCPRPISKIETQDSRAHIGPNTALGIQLRKMLMHTLKEANKVDWAWTYFLPTILFKIMKPEKFEAYVNDGRIATAKLTRLRTNTAILFQDQLNEMWARDSALVK
ncbi:MAG: hypothetical protein Q8O55_07590 [Dehalococcoidales bacterium]|nr:hypothetical protein [Dehalococcoidales bacterium]